MTPTWSVIILLPMETVLLLGADPLSPSHDVEYCSEGRYLFNLINGRY